MPFSLVGGEESKLPSGCPQKLLSIWDLPSGFCFGVPSTRKEPRSHTLGRGWTWASGSSTHQLWTKGKSGSSVSSSVNRGWSGQCREGSVPRTELKFPLAGSHYLLTVEGSSRSLFVGAHPEACPLSQLEVTLPLLTPGALTPVLFRGERPHGPDLHEQLLNSPRTPSKGPTDSGPEPSELVMPRLKGQWRGILGVGALILTATGLGPGPHSLLGWGRGSPTRQDKPALGGRGQQGS